MNKKEIRKEPSNTELTDTDEETNNLLATHNTANGNVESNVNVSILLYLGEYQKVMFYI